MKQLPSSAPRATDTERTPSFLLNYEFVWAWNLLSFKNQHCRVVSKRPVTAELR